MKVAQQLATPTHTPAHEVHSGSRQQAEGTKRVKMLCVMAASLLNSRDTAWRHLAGIVGCATVAVQSSGKHFLVSDLLNLAGRASHLLAMMYLNASSLMHPSNTILRLSACFLVWHWSGAAPVITRLTDRWVVAGPAAQPVLYATNDASCPLLHLVAGSQPSSAGYALIPVPSLQQMMFAIHAVTSSKRMLDATCQLHCLRFCCLYASFVNCPQGQRCERIRSLHVDVYTLAHNLTCGQGHSCCPRRDAHPNSHWCNLCPSDTLPYTLQDCPMQVLL